MIERIQGLRDRLLGRPGSDPDRRSVLRESRELEVEADRLGFAPLSRHLHRIALLIEFRENLIDDAPAEASELTSVAVEGLSRLAQALADGEAHRPFPEVQGTSSARWDEILRIMGSDEEEGIDGGAGTELAEASSEFALLESIPLVSRNLQIRPASETPRSVMEDEDDDPPKIDKGQLFEMLFGAGDRARAPRPLADARALPATQRSPRRSASPPFEDRVGFDDSPPAVVGVSALASEDVARTGELEPALEDPEIRESFRADCEGLILRISSIVEEFDRGDPTPEIRIELGRHLHTLKGAAGAVGLLDLSQLVHQLEDMNEEAARSSGPARGEFLVRLHDLVLRTEAILSGFASRTNPKSPAEFPAPFEQSPRAQPAVISEISPSPSGSRRDETTGSDLDETVRVSISRLGELMDLIAELFLRNSPRAKRAEEVKELSDAARSCRNRLTASIDRLCDIYTTLNVTSLNVEHPTQSGRPGSTNLAVHREMVGLIRHLTEQADDLAVVAETARSLSAPMMDDADASARLVRQVWDLLHDIRVVPVRPLLQRLARVTRAAAKIEGKPVEVAIIGGDLCLDRLIQDKIFEPLLHVVRNAIGHGIESPEVRLSAGKPPTGRVTLAAGRDDQAFVFTVRDDGGGLDDAAIEAKARALGLLLPGEAATSQQLREIIFRPGFTTRHEVDSISGRGLGMDVVAKEVAQLQGTIRLESEAGTGTSLSIRLPSQLTLEQSMIIRVDGQSFAIPLNSVEVDPGMGRTEREGDFAEPPVDARIALGLNSPPPSHNPRVLRVMIQGVKRDVLVDSIEGPRELVARPLHPLLSAHPVISGTSLASDGDLILLINPAGLARDEFVSPAPAPPRPVPVLLVDDSISVRRSVYRHLRSLGLEVDEASDGVEALKLLRDRSYRFMITDIDMPRMSGFELLTELAKERPSSRPPVIVSSSRSDLQTRQTAQSLGARAFIVKPIGMEELAEVVGPLLKAVPG